MVGRSFFRSVRPGACAPQYTIPAVLLLLLLAFAPAARAQAPDLVVEGLTFTPTKVMMGTNVTTLPFMMGGYPYYASYRQPIVQISMTIRNAGTRPSFPMVTKVWASPDGVIDGTGNDILIETLMIGSLPAGGSVVYNTASNTTLKFDPNFVGVAKNQFLTPGSWRIGVMVDVLDQNLNEISEKNTFVSPLRLNTEARLAWPMRTIRPGVGTITASVGRQIEWTSAPYANRYDLYFSRIKDMTQDFLPRELPGVSGSKIWVTDMGGPAENLITYSSFANRVPYRGAVSTLKNLSTRDVTPDLLVAKDNKLLLYMNKNQGDPFTNNPPVVPQFFDPIELLATSGSLGSVTQYGSQKYGTGSITSAIPLNLNPYYINNKHNNNQWDDMFMDVVCAEYDWTWRGSWKPDKVTYFSSDRALEGTVYVILNVTSASQFRFGTTATPAPRPEQLETRVIPLWNDRGWAGDNTNPLGIKCLAAGDMDNDTDIDIIAGSDRLWNGAISDKVVIYQSSYRNMKEDDPGVYPPEDPTFKPRAVADNQRLEDAHDMCVGDYNKDGKMDIAVASWHGHSVWILQNNTDMGGSDDSTRTLNFSTIGPLLAFDSTNTTIALFGASTIASCDLNNDRKPDLIAGGYYAGQIVVYESRASGDMTTQDFKPHMLSYTLMQNVEKVLGADMNGDGLMDVVASSATNDRIAWWENLGNFQFRQHIATENDETNHVGYIASTDMNNDMLPDIISLSQIGDTANPPMRWYANFPTFTSKNLVGKNLLAPRMDVSQLSTSQRMDFNTMYGFQIVSKSCDSYTTAANSMFFRTQPTRVKLFPSIKPFNLIEPGSGAYVQMEYLNDGPQDCNGFAVECYCDANLGRAFAYNNQYYTFETWRMFLFGGFDLHRGYAAGTSSTQPGMAPITVSFDGSAVPEGLYNFWVAARGRTPIPRDGVRNFIFDGVVDGFDGWGPASQIDQEFTAYPQLYGDDVYLAQEQMGIALKPGLTQKLDPPNNAKNISTSTKFSWTTTNYTTGYDLLMSKAMATDPIYTSTTITTLAPAVKSMAAADLNGDAQTDVVCSFYKNLTGQVYWYKNAGTGRRFDGYPIATNFKNSVDVSLCNMDPERDGANPRPDVLVASKSDNLIQWQRNMGGATASFSPPTIVSNIAFSVNSARGADLNGDKLIDVLAAMDSESNRLCWFQRSGSTVSYTKRVIDTANGSPILAIPSDLDSDGDMDVLAAFWSPSSIAWYENTGRGTSFVRRTIDNTLNSPQWLAVGDMDNDDDPDIVCVSNKEGRIVWFENNGNTVPGFTMRNVATGVTGVRSLELTDFNHDSRPDVISASTQGTRLLYFENRGGLPLAFFPRIVSSGATEFTAACSGDMEGDSYPEVIGSNSQGTMTWFDYTINFQFANQPMVKTNNTIITGTATYVAPDWRLGYTPPTMEPAQGYMWQVLAKRVIPVYSGTFERITSSTVNSFYTSQSDLVAMDLKPAPDSRTVPLGKNLKFVVYEKNIGLCDAVAHRSEVWASRDPDAVITRSGNDIFLGYVNMPAIPPGVTLNQPLVVNTLKVGPLGTWKLLPGMYYVGLFANTDGADNSESTKANNKVIPNLRITITVPNSVDEWSLYD